MYFKKTQKITEKDYSLESNSTLPFLIFGISDNYPEPFNYTEKKCQYLYQMIKLIKPQNQQILKAVQNNYVLDAFQELKYLPGNIPIIFYLDFLDKAATKIELKELESNYCENDIKLYDDWLVYEGNEQKDKDVIEFQTIIQEIRQGKFLKRVKVNEVDKSLWFEPQTQFYMYILMLHVFPEFHFVNNPKMSILGDIIGYSPQNQKKIYVHLVIESKEETLINKESKDPEKNDDRKKAILQCLQYMHKSLDQMSKEKVIDVTKKSLFGIAGSFEDWCFIKVTPYDESERRIYVSQYHKNDTELAKLLVEFRLQILKNSQ